MDGGRREVREIAAMEVFIVSVLLGLIPAAIAHSKGRSFFTFWFCGVLLFIFALPYSLFMEPNSEVLEARRRNRGA